MGKVPIEKRSHLARNIISRRNALGWNQESLAHEAGLHVSVIKKLETDKGEGEPETREAIAGALECTLSELYQDPDALIVNPMSKDQIEKEVKEHLTREDLEEFKSDIIEKIMEIEKGAPSVASPRTPYLSTKASKLLKIFDRLTPEGQDIILRQAGVALKKYALPLKGAE